MQSMPRPARTGATMSGFDYDAAVIACAKGNKQSLQALYNLEASRMIAVAMRILKRQAAAEDAVQDTFVQIWNKATSFDPTLGSARGWMYTILRNRALNMLRAEDKIDLTDNFDHLEQISDDDDPERVMMRLSEESALRKCLETLEPKRRNAIVIAYTQGLTHGELAGKMGVPLGTMKAWIRRGLLALRECLG